MEKSRFLLLKFEHYWSDRLPKPCNATTDWSWGTLSHSAGQTHHLHKSPCSLGLHIHCTCSIHLCYLPHQLTSETLASAFKIIFKSLQTHDKNVLYVNKNINWGVKKYQPISPHSGSPQHFDVFCASIFFLSQLELWSYMEYNYSPVIFPYYFRISIWRVFREPFKHNSKRCIIFHYMNVPYFTSISFVKYLSFPVINNGDEHLTYVLS